MAQTSAFCLAQQSIHHARSLSETLPNARGVALAAANAWGREAKLAASALEPGGLLAFHDYRSQRDPGVTDAVNSILAAGARLLRTAGTVAVVQPC